MEKIDSFYRMVTEFCNYFKENEITDESIDYLITSLMKIYIAALTLPIMDPETDEVPDTEQKGKAPPFAAAAQAVQLSDHDR